MSILADTQIKQLCTLPNFVVTQMVPQEQDPTCDVRLMPQAVKTFSWLTDKKLLEADIVSQAHMFYNARYRPFTDQDKADFKPMISPFEGESVKLLTTHKGPQRILSYGLSSYGYDMVLSKEDLKIFTNINSTIVDPRNADPRCYTAPELRTDEDGLLYVVQPPNSIMLGHTREWFNIPRDVLATCLGKSTYARVGISLIVTPLEPEWSGNLVVEIVNHTSSPVKIYPEQGIGQLTFMQADVICDTSYADRGGKYQSQIGTTDAKV